MAEKLYGRGHPKKWSMFRAGWDSDKAQSLHHKAPCYANRRGERPSFA